MLKLTYASISENGTINGLPGDQTGQEVKTRPYYNFGQQFYTRFVSKSRRKKFASIAKKLASNNNIGYSQPNRKSLFDECNRIGWDASRIYDIRKCNCDCSMLVICAINLAYGKIKLPHYLTTSDFANNKIHKLMPKATYSQKEITPKHRLGDIVYRRGHVAIITEL